MSTATSNALYEPTRRSMPSSLSSVRSPVASQTSTIRRPYFVEQPDSAAEHGPVRDCARRVLGTSQHDNALRIDRYGVRETERHTAHVAELDGRDTRDARTSRAWTAEPRRELIARELSDRIHGRTRGIPRIVTAVE